MNTEPVLLILAAGIGSRYGSAKQIDCVGPSDEIIMDYSVYDAIRTGIKKVVFVINQHIEKEFNDVILKKYKPYIKVDYVIQSLENVPKNIIIPKERIKPWGTAHAILTASKKIKGPFISINADDFYGLSSFKVIYDFLTKSTNEFAMIGFPIHKTLSENGSVSRGICKIDRNNYLIDIIEKSKIKKINNKIFSEENRQCKEISLNSKVSMNFWGFNSSIFPEIQTLFNTFITENVLDINKEFHLPEAIDSLIKSGFAKVKVLESKTEWFGITHNEDKDNVQQKLEKLINDRVYPSKLF